MPQLNKVSEINLPKIVELLNKFYKYADITKILNSRAQEIEKNES